MQQINEIAAIGILAAAFVLVLALAQFMHSRFGVRAEHTRKFAHVAIGLACVLVPFHFTNHWYLLIGNIGFIGYLLYARRQGQLPSLFNIGRESWGDVLLSVSIYGNALLVIQYDFEALFYLPLLILAVADPAAYYAGQFFNKKNKSWIGSTSFIVVAWVASWLYLTAFAITPYPSQAGLLVACAVLGAMAEHISVGGWDNLTVPLTVAGVLVVYHEIIYEYAAN